MKPSNLEPNPRLVDLLGAIAETKNELKTTPAAKHIDFITYLSVGTKPHQAFTDRIKKHAPIERHFVRRDRPSHHVVYDHVPVDGVIVPDLLNGDCLNEGFALGLYVTNKVIGRATSDELTPYVDRTMTVDTTNPEVYAAYLNKLGSDTYSRHLSTQSYSAQLSDNPLRPFVRDYMDEAYGTYDTIGKHYPFMIGVGLARAAYNSWSRDTDSTLSGIAMASNKRTPE